MDMGNEHPEPGRLDAVALDAGIPQGFVEGFDHEIVRTA
jgi:hypothetical protein